MDVFDEWRRGGTTFTWASTTPAKAGQQVEVFARRAGTPGAPALVCVHGFPTASIDFRALAGELSEDVEIFTLDFPGYGLSEKPSAIPSTTTRDYWCTRSPRCGGSATTG